MADEDKPALLAKEPEAAETVVEPVDPAQLPEPEPDLATEAIPVPPPVARPARGLKLKRFREFQGPCTPLSAPRSTR